jgi:hypothetical protein
MDNKNINNAAKAIADWWVKVIRKSLNQDNGASDRTSTAFNALMCKASEKAKEVLTSETIDKFHEALIESIIRFNELHPTHSIINIDCDYNPNSILQYAVDQSGIDIMVIPIKHGVMLFIHLDYLVEAFEGYRALPVKIF